MADVEAWIDLFAWVEDVFGVEDVLCFFEDIEHFFGEHEVEVWRTDDAVVVLTADVTLKLDGGSKERVSHFFDENGSGFIGEV